MVFPHSLLKPYWASVTLGIWSNEFTAIKRLLCVQAESDADKQQKRSLQTQTWGKALPWSPMTQKEWVTVWDFWQAGVFHSVFKPHRAWFYCPDKTSSRVIVTGSCLFSCPHCNGAARDQRENHTSHFSHRPVPLTLPQNAFYGHFPLFSADGLNITSKRL